MNKEYPEIDIDKYKAVQLQDYKGVIGLLALSIGGGENITYFKQWVYLSHWKNGKNIPTAQKMPMAVRLGDRGTAIKILEELLRQIKE